MRILVVGFGAMGCRHVQSLLNSADEFEVVVVEPSQENFDIGLSRIGAEEADLLRVADLGELSGEFDFAVVATSSGPRYQIVKSLLEYGIKRFLLEKVVFQSETQFDEIIKLLEEKRATAHCNFVNRYFPNYQKLKQVIQSTEPGNLDFTVYGGDFGLACNILHYLDLFEYLTNSKLNLASSSLELSNAGNHRGDIYRELTGYASGESDMGYTLSVASVPDYSGECVITVNVNKDKFIMNEGTTKEAQFIDGEILETHFDIIPTSQLTGVLVNDIVNEKCVLPEVSDTRHLHLEVFKHFNPAFSLEHSADTICPIT